MIKFIPGNIPSLKNSKIKTSRGIFPSKTVKKYLQEIGIVRYSVSKKIVEEYKTKPNIFKQSFTDWTKPNKCIVIGFHFVRKSKHKFDFHNAVQIIADLLVAHDLIEDDNMDWFIPVPVKLKGKWYSYNKDNPGVFIITDYDFDFIKDYDTKRKNPSKGGGNIPLVKMTRNTNNNKKTNKS